MKRRELIKNIGLTTALAAFAPFNASSLGATGKPVKWQTSDVEPSAAQKSWMDLKNGLFIHFGINTYYDTEWSDGTLDLSAFNPTEMDTDQWCSAAKAAGMKYIVMVTKHHDGFCNWDTAHTEYSVMNTPYGKDLLTAVVDSARKHDLQVGLYYSLWDRREQSHDNDEYVYVDFMKRQLKELLTGYGPIVELWFDGFWKKQQSGWTKKEEIEGENIDAGKRLRDEEFIEAWRMEGAYRWQIDHLYQYIKSFQPDCLVMNNSTTAYPGVPLHPVDIRTGEKATKIVEDRKVWSFLGKEMYFPLQIETTLSTEGDSRFPSGNWFWHEWDHSVASKEQILEWRRVATKMEANLLINAGPMANGKLRPEDEAVLLSLA